VATSRKWNGHKRPNLAGETGEKRRALISPRDFPDAVVPGVPGLPKDTVQQSPKLQLWPRATKEEAAATELTPIQPTLSTSKPTMSAVITTAVTQPARRISTTTPVQTTT